MKLNKNTKIIIVIPNEPLKTEQFAAEELAHYLHLSIGANPQISKERDKNACHFIIGGPQRNDEALTIIDNQSFAAEVPGPEGIYIDINENDVLLAGSFDNDTYDRGTLYAVYEFLERYMDCCFGAYSKNGVAAGEVVPKHSELLLQPDKYCKSVADLPYRTAIVQYNSWVGNADHALNPAFFSWLAKNRYNRILTWVGIYEQYISLGLVDELEKRGIQLSVGHHQASSTWLPPYGNEMFPKQYAKENPEFYRLEEDGTRFIPKDDNDYNGQLIFCNRNTALIEEVAKNVNKWIAENPLVDIIAFWPNDGVSPQCCCESCAKHSKMENYLYFENELAKRVTAVHPNVKIDVLVYVDLWECPTNMQFCDGIQIDESTWAADALRSCGKPDGSCVIGTKFEKNLLDYQKKCKNTVFYEYYMGNYGNKQKVMPSADELQSLYKHYKKVGISGSGTQLECFNLWNNLLNFYCFARTAYDTTLSLSQQIKSLCRLFGSGGQHIAKIFDLYELTMDGQVPITESGIFFAQNINKEYIYTLFESALSEADSAIAKNNIRLLRMAFRYTDISTQSDGQTGSAAYAAELDYMFTHFNSYLTSNGYGIAIPDRTKTNTVCDDIWYTFDTKSYL